MSTIRDLYRMDRVAPMKVIKTYAGYQVQEPNQSEQLIGIEVEVENHTVKKSLQTEVWRGTADGSLRNAGLEYVSQPIPAKHGPAALMELLGDSLDEKECCFSPRTSIHVHFDMQDVDEEKVKEVVLLYTLFERLFFKFTGRGRIKNIYCVPLIDTAVLNGFAFRALHDGTGQWSKYSALNLLPLREYGTIEARHMHGTFDIRKVSIWIRLWCKLIEYAKANDIMALGKAMDGRTDYEGLVRMVFGADAEYLKFESMEDVEQSVGRIKTAFVNPRTVRALQELRHTQSPFYEKA